MAAQRREDWRRVRDIFEASLAQPAGRRPSFVADSCRGEPEIEQQVRALLASHDHAADFLEAPILKMLGDEPVAHPAAAEGSDPTIGRTVGPYVIESCIGHGGMGAVFMARRADSSFERRVAIKMIRRGMDSGVVIRKFQQERQILASLDHPHIARLYDGGTTEDGVPYLVMELVEGSHIDAYCDGRGLSVTDRLQLFRQVCEAVQYAHQRLVIHRDLKPGNILVQEDGVPKLLDFGIAKLLDGTPGVETTLSRPMTPAYASPEQIRGEPITTASDVYSLGVILYQLLTGRSPYAGDTRSSFELARAVCDAEPGRPSTVVLKPLPDRDGDEIPLTPEALSRTREGSPLKLRRRLAGDLDNIILKALRKEPQQRYPSVEQFSADVRRHLERLPITASKGSFGYRAGKFVARHKILAAAAAVVLLAILGGTGATVRQARLARLQAEIAQTERTRAEQRFTDVRRLTNSMIFELHDSIEDLPGATAARKLIMERALQYLDGLGRESRGDPSLQRELAEGYRRIGDLQGGPYTANVGDTASALRSYERAWSIRQTLLASTPAELADLIGFAAISRVMSDALKANGNPSAALEHARRAVQTLESARPSHPADPGLLAELMRAYGAEASLYASSLVSTSLGNLPAALPLRRKQLEIAEQLSEMAPGDGEARRTLASALSVMGDQLLMTGQRRQASEHFVRAQQLLLQLTGLSTSRMSLFALHDSYYRMLPLQLADGELELARTTAQRAVDIVQQLVAADDHDAQARLVLAADLANFGEVMSLSGKHEEARAALAKAMAIDAELSRRHPNTAQFRTIRFQRLLSGGRISYLRGNYPQAIQHYRAARDILAGMIADDPNNQGSRVPLGVASNGMGAAFARLEDLEAASQAYQQTLAVLAKTLDSGLPGEDAVYAAAGAYAGLGQLEAARAAAALRDRAARIAHLRQALAWTDRSLELWQRIQEPGLTSPSGYECTPLHDVRSQRARIAADLAAF
jgi:serine/threonine protein kinase/tetratricopeptide (TPR) repeat protein